MNERELVIEYKAARDALRKAEDAKKECQRRFDEIQSKLVEDLEARDASSTAKYDVGRVSLEKPRLFASVLKENQETLFSFLRKIGRDDLIKPGVHPSTLSSWVSEMTESGEALPEFINVAFKRTTRITS